MDLWNLFHGGWRRGRNCGTKSSAGTQRPPKSSYGIKVKRVKKLHPPSFQVRAGAAFLLFARSVASRKQDNLDRQAAFIFIIDFHLVPLIALAIVAALTFWGVLPGRYFE